MNINIINQGINTEEIKKLKRHLSYLNYIEIPITTHCNLNCKACNHFAPIMPEWQIELEQFINYMKVLNKLSQETPRNTEVFNLCILGGEPLLHSNIEQLCTIAREYLPNNDIYISTNGLLLKNKADTFFDCLNNNKIGVEFSNYINSPMYQDGTIFNIMQTKLNKFIGPGCYCVNNPIKDHGGFLSSRFNFEQQYDSVKTYSACMRDMPKIMLYNNKLYKCAQTGYIDKFLNYFNINKQIILKNKIDYLDLADISYSAVIDFLQEPGTLCSHCSFLYNNTPEYWCLSNRELSEWL